MEKTVNSLGGLFSILRSRPGLTLLTVILTIITINTLKPNFYLIGWDNYSPYFNLKTNLFRTFFATWREYRGLGVPSDAEVTDIFRQIFFWGIHFFVPEELLDQIYYLVSLWLGTLGMYALSRLLLKHFTFRHENHSLLKTDVFPTIASFFYLFNLSTLSVFYSPIIPFTNRFYALPLTLYVALRFITKKTIKNFLLAALTIIVTSGSYITPTVIITSLVAFFTFLLTHLNLKKALIYSLVFLLLNAFWLLPFFNYTLQKSAIIPLARTFVEINEATLNKPASVFSLGKQTILYPSFLDISFPPISGESQPIHPLLNDYKSQIGTYTLAIFPALYLLGTLLILIRWRKNRQPLWIPIWIAAFLFLSTKQFGPLGFVYSWFEKNIPFFSILFRISDTKFHAYISLAGSLAAAYAVLTIVLLFQKKTLRYLVTFTFFAALIWYAWLFRSYATGQLIGYYTYTQIPQEYFELAELINTNPGNGRVLHLPMDVWHHYWRSFSWGYLGSAFFNFLIDKPYIDKTFEPASLENSSLHQKLTTLSDAFYRAENEPDKAALAHRFLNLLHETGIQYLIADQSITATIYPRNLLYSARQYLVQYEAILDYLETQGAITQVRKFTISLSDLYPAYQKLYPVSLTGIPQPTPQETTMTLYEIAEVRPTFSYLPQVTNIDPLLVNLLETDSDTTNKPIIQNQKIPSQLIPFMQQNHRTSQDETSFTLDYQNPNPQNLEYSLTSTPTQNPSYLIDVSASVSGELLTLTFFHRYYPDINHTKFVEPLGTVELSLREPLRSSPDSAYIIADWPQATAADLADNYRLNLNDVFIPLPANLSNSTSYIGSFMLHQAEITATLFAKDATEAHLPISLSPTDPLTCYGPKLEGFRGDVATVNQNELALSAQNGSACAATQIALPQASERLYAEVELTLQGNFDQQENQNSSLSTPIQVYVCALEGAIPDCLNRHRNLRVLQESTSFRLPLARELSPFGVYTLQVGTVNPQGFTQTTTLQNLKYHFYSPSDEQTLAVSPTFPEATITLSGPLKLSFPKAISPYSYVHKPETELFYTPLEYCRDEVGRQKTFGITNNNTFITQMTDCSTHVAQWFEYAFQSPYLFAFEYWLGSGQQPTIVLGLRGDDYLFERASLYQGYPNLPDWKKSLHVDDVNLTFASRLIPPRPAADTFSKNMAIHLAQDTANEGLLAVRNFAMVEYPQAWHSLTLSPQDSAQTYPLPQSELSFRKILPSLWTIDHPQPGLLMFNQGYDKQWGVYDSLWGLIAGSSLTPSVRCQGFANCFDLTGINSQKLYVFYWPERLAILGWITTFLTVIIGLRLIRRQKAKSSLAS